MRIYSLVFTVMLAEPQGNTQLAAGVQGAHTTAGRARCAQGTDEEFALQVLRACSNRLTQHMQLLCAEGLHFSAFHSWLLIISCPFMLDMVSIL